MTLFVDERRVEARAILERYPDGRERSAIMPLLYLAQSIEGHVSRDALREVAELLGLATAEVEAVATFYTMYRLRPTGTHVVNVCTNLACTLRGARDVYEAAHQAAGMGDGEEVSEDGLLTVHEEECLGVCDFAPAVQINFANHDRVTPDRIRELVGALRAGEVPQPSRGSAVGSFKEASRVLAGLEPEEATA
ncbi:MAG TPA: NAD(P)H-dependent oxidoreductase subunit E [Actinomycetota bacterium]|nr:NAD(P)H-dependent oxidoreductase subunit E [Actinomycetota bacterium]